jgi:hypothetical protein
MVFKPIKSNDEQLNGIFMLGSNDLTELGMVNFRFAGFVILL